ncbi:putative membrane protein YczE [Caldalkalibacillus uzonensis]|uniref:Membrane protein YczE n=2 Tax=Caldalkalibacillus uzonensis TaxID=353224 RepID=A0ABU0CSY2_9BACI|nr:putative membrane protein YczE [Caldalkalibacillus uzonensis]
MRGEQWWRGSSVFVIRWLIFMLGVIIMSFGIVLMIKADMGNAPWDVFHIGLYYQFGLTIGLWSILVGIVIIGLTWLLTRTKPQVGAVINMLLVGLFIDLFLLIPWLKTPEHWGGQLVLLLTGIVVMGYGVGLYIAPRCGAGPRDGLMIAISEKTGWKVQWVRTGMEVLVLISGWILGGPVFVGTLLFSVLIGPVVGFSLPQCQVLVDKLIGGVSFENLNKRPVRVNHHDGISQ